MQKLDEKKRQTIAEEAAKLFATKPYHKVTLDDIAAAAGVGKGTLYIYFPSKEELFSSIVQHGFDRMLDGIKRQLADRKVTPGEGLRHIVEGLFRFAFSHPYFFELIRTAPALVEARHDYWRARHAELTQLIRDTIRAGVESGEFVDAHPELTAIYIPGLVRSTMLFGPKDLDERTVANHVLEFLSWGLCARDGAVAGLGLQTG